MQIENRVQEEKNLNSVENVSPRSTSGVIAAAILPSSLIENKEPQQVITLVNQPPPSVSSPVAIQPTSQQVFDFYRPVAQTHSGIPVTPNQDIERENYIQAQQENNWQAPQQLPSQEMRTPDDLRSLQGFRTPQDLRSIQELRTSQDLSNHQDLRTPQDLKNFEDLRTLQHLRNLQELQTPQELIKPTQITTPQQITSYQVISHPQYSQNSYPQSHEFHYEGTSNLIDPVKPQEVRLMKFNNNLRIFSNFLTAM